jgi:hypothetical protein
MIFDDLGDALISRRSILAQPVFDLANETENQNEFETQQKEYKSITHTFFSRASSTSIDS